ncbi:autotransporter domain-containing protein [Cellulophaga lytica]|uniref:autotransporter domain-containing protein n=1 Tax=Cellulophaga lytica TaxID=979 RepID=UPI000B5CB0DF|nr:autotransporter domain-containing protein [Cellulophaga lytica]SNQ41961.1 conserved exported hypothetical protein [Cellulophaga lytica]
MKKLFIAAIASLGFVIGAQAQEASTNVVKGQTSKGKWLIEANTNFGKLTESNTSFSLRSEDGDTSWSVGAEGGYFLADDLAVKVGLGYFKGSGNGRGSSSFSYKLGAKYYIASMIPVQVDFSGVSIKDYDDNATFVGLQGGYAIFLGKNVSVEPGLRYNVSLDEDVTDSQFQFNIGFALHF